MKPVEAELRRIEEVTAEIVQEMEYLREREMKLRDTNESTNERVKWFAIGTMGTLISLAAWQVVYLRSYFRLVMVYKKAERRQLLILYPDQSISFEELNWRMENAMCRGVFCFLSRYYVHYA